MSLHNYLKGDAFYDEKSKTIFNAIMGEGEKNKDDILVIPSKTLSRLKSDK